MYETALIYQKNSNGSISVLVVVQCSKVLMFHEFEGMLDAYAREYAIERSTLHIAAVPMIPDPRTREERHERVDKVEPVA
jgi:hypothetical protein